MQQQYPQQATPIIAAEPPFPSLKWSWALRDSDLPPRLKDLARLMASYANEQGYLRPSILTLRMDHVQDADKQSLSAPNLFNEKTIDRRVKRLINAGWFRIAARAGKGKTTVYQMTFPAGLEPEGWLPRTGHRSPSRTGHPNGTSNGTSDVPPSETGSDSSPSLDGEVEALQVEAVMSESANAAPTQTHPFVAQETDLAFATTVVVAQEEKRPLPWLDSVAQRNDATFLAPPDVVAREEDIPLWLRDLGPGRAS